MSTSAGPADLTKRTTASERIVSATRHVLGVVTGGLIAAIAWLLVMQEAYKRDLTQHDYNRVMGQWFTEGTGEHIARTGYRATLVAGIIVAAIFALVVNRLLRGRRSIVAALLFTPVPFLAWGLLLAPLVDATRPGTRGSGPAPIPGGVLGLDADPLTPVVALVASLLASMVIVRAYRLMSGRRWWETRPLVRQEAVSEIEGLAGVTPLTLQLPGDDDDEEGETPKGQRRPGP